MERESFEDVATAAHLMNEQFINIKVDREERPDLDQIYQLVVQLMRRSGGWPLTVFLTPQQKPFYAGTYFPPEERYGYVDPSRASSRWSIAEAYRDRRGDVELQASGASCKRDRYGQQGRHLGRGAKLGPDLARTIASRRSSCAASTTRTAALRGPPQVPEHDAARGASPSRRTPKGRQPPVARVRRALGGMQGGGIYDQLGGGFHRYSTDESWLVPHFEKMLYDNALLLRIYVDALPGHPRCAMGRDRVAHRGLRDPRDDVDRGRPLRLAGR